MPRYIDADNIPYEYDNNFRVVAPKHQIDHMTTEDVQPVIHAKWIETGDEQLDNIYFGNKCSECGFIYCGDFFYYCPECGAKMDKE